MRPNHSFNEFWIQIDKGYAIKTVINSLCEHVNFSSMRKEIN